MVNRKLVAFGLAALMGALAVSAGPVLPARGIAHAATLERIQGELGPLLGHGALPILPPLGSVASSSLDEDALSDVEADRAEILAWIDQLLQLQPHLEDFAEPGASQRLRVLRQDVETMTPERLALTKAQLGDHPGLWQLPAMLLSLFEPDQPMPPFYAEQARAWASMRGVEAQYGLQPLALDVVATPDPTAAPYPTMDPFPPRDPAPERPADRPGCPGVFNEGTCDECGPQIPLEAVFAAKVAALVVNGVKDTIGTAAQDTCAPPGVGFTVPDVAYYVVVGLSAAAEAALASLEFINDLNEDCEHGYHKAITDLYLDETVSSRVSQASYDEHALLQMRLKIERNLLRQADDRISLFQLPQAQCGSEFDGYRFCGKLETVREIVADTIQDNQNAMSVTDLNNATAELEAGDMHYMSSQWKAAYERYSTAYRFAVKQRSVR